MSFGGLKAVDDLSLTLHEREILSVIGPNGAGKTTVFNLVSGIYPPSLGKVLFEGADITGLKPHQVVKAGIARTFQNLRLFSNMSVLDNVKVSSSAGPNPDRSRFCFTYPVTKRRDRDRSRHEGKTGPLWSSPDRLPVRPESYVVVLRQPETP